MDLSQSEAIPFDFKGIVFSSGRRLDLAKSLASSLNKYTKRKTWETWEALFPEDTGKSPILNQFIKRLLVIDAAVLLLTDDDVLDINPYDDEERNAKVAKKSAPRDNVIFEVGAIMSRIGLKRTFIITPDLDLSEFRLLDYLDNFNRYKYPEASPDKSIDSSLDKIAEEIVTKLKAIGESIYHSDLPAIGLCYGYQWNFLNVIKRYLELAQQVVVNGVAGTWKPEDGYTLTLVMPHQLLGSRDARAMLEKDFGLMNLSLKNPQGRDFGVYIHNYQKEGKLHIIDIPTTLFTSKSVIDRVENYWKEEDNVSPDRQFRDSLASRELLAFERELRKIVSEYDDAEVIDIDDLRDRLEDLQ